MAIESYVEMYRTEFGVEAAIIRWFNAYGPRQPLLTSKGYRKAVPTWIANGLTGKPIEVYGSGEQTMDLVFARDAVSAVLAVMDRWSACEGKTFDVGSGEETPANTLATRIQELTGGASPITHASMRPGETEGARIKADLQPIGAATEWQPRVSLDDGLKETIDWYRRSLS